MKNVEVSFEVPVEKLKQLTNFLKSINIKSNIHLSCAPKLDEK